MSPKSASDNLSFGGETREELAIIIEKSRSTADRLKKIIASQPQLLEIEKDLPDGYGESDTCRESTHTVINRLKEHRRELDTMNVELGKYINELEHRISNRDTKDLKQAEEVLKLTQASIDLAANEILWITPEGEIVYANEATCAALQRSREEILGMYVWDIHPTYTREKWQEHWQEIKERGSFTFETTHYAKSGREFPVEVSVNYVISDGKEFNFAYIKDITERKRVEEALLVSEERLHRASSAGHIGLFEWNLDRGTGYLSPGAYELFGYDPGSPATYEKWLATVHPDDRESVDHTVTETREKARNICGASTQIEYRVHRPDGAVLWILATVTCNIEGGDLIARGAVRDITERKRVEEALRESEEKYRELVENANSIILRFNVNGYLTFFNEHAEMLFGYSKDEVIGMNVVGTIVPLHETTGRDLAALMEEIKRYPMLYQLNVNENICKNGDRLWIAWTNRAIIDEHGNVVEILSVGNDITERKRAEDALRHSEAHLAKSQEIAHIGSFQWDPLHHEDEWSDEMYSILGVRRGELKPSLEAFGHFLHPEDRETFKKLVDNFLKDQNYAEKPEFRVVRPDGIIRWVSLEAKSIPGRSGKLVRIGIMVDITDRKRAEEELADAKARAELYIDLMGHDINNLNQVARGYLELIDSMADNEKIKQLVNKPMEAINSSSRLIQNVQKLQRCKSSEHRREVIDLGTLIEEVAGQMESAPDRHMYINHGVIKGIHVLADELLRDVFANLIGNAIKHSTESPHIDIRMIPQEKAGKEYCRVTIDDNGPGIPDNMKEKIFDRLSRGNTKAKGSGLGLYLVKTLVESYGGNVWVEDRVKGDPMKGARFTVELPVV